MTDDKGQNNRQNQVNKINNKYFKERIYIDWREKN